MDKRLKKLKIVFPDGWVDISNENPDGPPTFINEKLDAPGVLQISIADYISGDKPVVQYNDLIELSKSAGLKSEFGESKTHRSGSCKFGKYGFAKFSRPDFPYITVWHLTNGKDFIFSTFISTKIPKQKEISEVEEILMSIKMKGFLF